MAAFTYPCVWKCSGLRQPIVHVMLPVGLSTWRCASIGCPQLGQNQLFFHWLFFLSESECDAAWHRAAVKKPRVKPVKRQMMAISMRSPVSLDGFCDEADRDDQQNP